MALGITPSAEYRGKQVLGLYDRFLQRAADPVGLPFFVSFLQQGGTLEEAEALMLSSPEYLQSRGGDSDNGFLSALYGDVLGRSVDPLGASVWGTILAGGQFRLESPRLQVATGVVTSQEARQDRIQGFYEQFLHRVGEPSGVSFWGAQITTGVPIEQVVAGFVGSEEYRLHLETQAPPPPVPMFDLAAGTADLGPQTTSAARVTLVGLTAPGVSVTLLGTGLTALASGTGAFQIPGVNLAIGDNMLTVQASNPAGNTSSFTRTVTRSAATSGQPNAVIVWNQATLNAIQQDGSDPLFASRGLAMVQAAVFDAVNAIAGTPAYYAKITAPAGASIEAAVPRSPRRPGLPLSGPAGYL